ncbi:MAG: hypothetical protein BGO25_00915 [Acidobacteriales bacterium 59-55]|nr:MAG: hypothetical protein BGO25_00915 [Acidobacteriales bacterium 59-55]
MISKASLISFRNLDLAWSRITTAKNLQHKRMFRHLYGAYEPGRTANLKLLHEKLKGAWKPTSPIRMYMPKASGMLRPLTLLSLDDQIVLQAITNQVAKQMFKRRRAVESKLVFSSVQNSNPDSIFFLVDWRRTYHDFKLRLSQHLGAGNHWIAHFDLAAFYETISHRALQSIVSPSGGSNEAWDLIRKWLCVWTSDANGIPVDHGIPQGPIASDFLAEIFLLPLDEAMVKAGIPYIRYVDDIRVLAKTEDEVRRAAVVLEMECRRWSLIPQGSKFKVSYARDVSQALGTLPSIAESTGQEADEIDLDEAEALKVFDDAIGGRPLRVIDKSRLRFVLYRSGPSRTILNKSLKLLSTHPEHIDAFAAFLQNYSKSRLIVRHIMAMLKKGVLHDYVQGELWMIASRQARPEDLQDLLPVATAQARRGHLSFSMQRALCVFFLTCRKEGLYSTFHALIRVRSKSAYIQSLLIPYLLNEDYSRGGFAAELCRRSQPAPGMTLAEEIVDRGLSLREMGISIAGLAPEVRNVFHGLGLISNRSSSRAFDQIDEIMRISYKLRPWRAWRKLLGSNYQHALQLLLTAENKFSTDRSGWLASQNSFNDALFGAFQDVLMAQGLPGAMSRRNRNNQWVSFGVMLQPQAPFACEFPLIAATFLSTNERRNGIPDSHPFEFRTGQKTKHLKVRERDTIKADLAEAYLAIIAYLNSLP